MKNYLTTYHITPNTWITRKEKILTNLNGLELADVTATEMLQNNATGNPIGAQSVEDGLLEPSHGSKGRVNVQRIAIPTEPVQGSLQG